MGADMETYQERIRRRVDEILPELSRLSDDLWNNPEYNFKEYFACKSMSALLEKYGFAVETGIGGLETSVKGVYDTGKEGPNIAIFGEFDAVEGMGHSCGHNIMCAISVGAGAALRSVIDELGGKVTVFGCPAEEGGGGKIIMAEHGALTLWTWAGCFILPATRWSMIFPIPKPICVNPFLQERSRMRPLGLKKASVADAGAGTV